MKWLRIPYGSYTRTLGARLKQNQIIMKNFILYYLVAALLGCNYSNKSNLNKTDSKPLKSTSDTFSGKKNDNTQTKDLSIDSREKLRKKGIYTFYEKDTLHVISNDKKEIKKLHISFIDSNKNNSYIVSSYSITQYQINNNLFVSLSVPTESFDIVIFYGLINVKNNQWLVEQRMRDTLFNAIYESSSYDNNFHLFIHEWNDGVSFKIINSNNIVLKQGYSNFLPHKRDPNVLKWQNGNKLYYYFIVNQDSLPDNLPGIDINNEKYALKYYWINGRDSFTKEYHAVIVQ